MVLTLSACAGTPMPDAASPSPERETLLPPENESGEDIPEAEPFDLTAFNGTWEGVLSEPLGHTVILDCAADIRPWKVSISLISDIWNYHYISALYAIEDGILTLRWNDEANRTTLTLSFTDENVLTGTYTQHGNTASAVFAKVSDTASRESFHIKLQENVMDRLSAVNDFNRADSTPVHFEYIMDDPRLSELREAYDLDTIAGEGDTQTKALNLLNWVGSHTNHDGNPNDHIAKNALALLEYAYKKGPQNGLDCSNLSIILAEACLSVGIQARALWLYPENPNDADKHVVTIAYIPESEKWILLDPSSNCYLSDMDGNILSPFEIRQMLADKEPMHINSNAKTDYMSYVNYLAKNMFFFGSVQTTKFGVFDENREGNPMIAFCPVGFDLTEWGITNLHFVTTHGYVSLTNEAIAQQEAAFRERDRVFATPESFWGHAD